jgi:hypothetical protein
MATITDDELKNFYPTDGCENLGDECQTNNDCCLELTCSYSEGMFSFFLLVLFEKKFF